MKIVIVGCGVIGVTTAYCLRRRGHEVTVIDRESGPGLETSFANGGLLTPSMPDPWNAPGSWRVLLGSLGRSDAALQLRLRTLPALVGWGFQFLRNSRPAVFERSRVHNLRLALYSLKAMDALRQQTGIEYGRSALGTLRVFRDQAALDRTATAAGGLGSEGLSFRKLTVPQMVDLEPALAPIAHQLTGAIHYESDEAGDAHQFCVALAEQAQRLGVEFRFRTEVRALQAHAGRVTALVADGGTFVADRYVVAAGSYGTPLLRRVGVHVPVCPAKGYSVTFEGLQYRQTLSIPVIDDDLHAAVIPLGAAIRVAGTAEFAGYDRTMNLDRARNLVALLQRILPQETFDVDAGKPWCGLRPMSVDGVPVIGATHLANLTVNTGHGPLGWTSAAGSAQLLTDLISGDPPSLDPAPFALARFL